MRRRWPKHIFAANIIVELLRATFVREATRFKATRSVVDVLARDAEVIDGAVHDAPTYHLPQTVASAVFSAIINSSVPFELCVVSQPITDCESHAHACL